MITADYDTLMRQAHETASNYYKELRAEYRDENVPPVIMAAMIQAAATDLAAAVLSVAIQELTEIRSR